MKLPILRRSLLAGAMLAAGAGAVVLGVTAAGAAGSPQVAPVVSSSGGTAVTAGHPHPEAAAKVQATYVAYNSANGDEAVAQDVTGNAHVYLIAGANEPNEYHLQTGTTAGTPVYGTLVKGDVYLLAGNGTVGWVANPGVTPTPYAAGSAHVTATQNPVAPFSVAFDHAGNVLIAGRAGTSTATQVVAKTTCTTAPCAYGYTAESAGGLYDVGEQGLTHPGTTPIHFTFGVSGFGMAVDTTGNIIEGDGNDVVFLNEQTTPVTRYGETLPVHKATTFAGTSTSTPEGVCGGGTVKVPNLTTATALLVNPHPYLDANNNLYINDQRVNKPGVGCDWVVPAASGTLDGMSVTAGNMYSLTGAKTTPVATTGATAAKASALTPIGITTDAAGNVVLETAGTNPSLRVIAESTGTYYGVSMTKGKEYYLAGGASATRTTPVAGTAKTFKLAPTTSLTNGALGNVLLSAGTTTTGAVYQVTGGPTVAPLPPTITSVTPATGPTAGGTTITIHGTNLTGATVRLSVGTPTAVTVVSPTVITFKDPAEPAGTTDSITVTTSYGTATATTAFTYVETPTTVTLSVTPSTIYAGTTVTLKATVTPSTATGSVTFDTGTTPINTTPVAVSGGSASYVTKFTTTGAHTVKAVFTPSDGTYVTSTSSVSALTVKAAQANGGDVYQQINQTVTAGFLTLSCTNVVLSETTAIKVCPLITLTSTPVTLNGTAQKVHHGMNTLYVSTARGNPTDGWTLTAAMVGSGTVPSTSHSGRHNLNGNAACSSIVAFCNATIGTHVTNTNGRGIISPAHLGLTGWACTPTQTTNTYVPAVGTGGTFASTITLCTAAHGTSGGQYSVGGGTFTLTVPSTVYAGVYYGTVQYTLAAS